MEIEENRPMDITSKQREIILALLKRYLPNTEVWAYGSRIKGTAKPYSDLDMVAFTTKEEVMSVPELREAFEESDLPFRVDFFIWDEIPSNFHRNIKEDHVILQERKTTTIPQR